MIVPPQHISDAALQGLVEEFITRDGTDYGEIECSLAEKVQQIRQSLQRGETVIVFDSRSETTTLMTRRDAADLL